ncbi:MAG: hypothetical protein AB1782_16650 [Cyanobacteriota bacterium]
MVSASDLRVLIISAFIVIFFTALIMPDKVIWIVWKTIQYSVLFIKLILLIISLVLIFFCDIINLIFQNTFDTNSMRQDAWSIIDTFGNTLLSIVEGLVEDTTGHTV